MDLESLKLTPSQSFANLTFTHSLWDPYFHHGLREYHIYITVIDIFAYTSISHGTIVAVAYLQFKVFWITC